MQHNKILLIWLVFFWANQNHLLKAQCWNLVWQDEFDGSTLDLNKWEYQVGGGGWGNGELQYYTEGNNIEVSNNTLKITANEDTANEYANNAYTSSRIRTQNKGDWRYGKMEARIKLPIGKGIWPAFWMMPSQSVYGTWPASGEIDIMEYLGHQASTTYATCHYGNAWNDKGSSGGSTNLATGSFNDDFHTFGIEWEADEIRWYLDDVLFHSTNSSHPDFTTYNWPFDQNFHFILNIAVGGQWPGSPDASTVFPQTMEVDWVRVYQDLADVAIVGDNDVAAYETTTYSLPNTTNATYNWYVPNTATLVSGQNTHEITVQWSGTSGTISASYNTTCGTQIYEMDVSVTDIMAGNTNLWENAGFENGTTNWNFNEFNGANANFDIVTTDVQEGSNAMCVTNLTVLGNVWNIQLSRQAMDVVAGETYTVSFWAKGNAATGQNINFAFINASTFAFYSGKQENITNNWAYYTFDFTPAETTSVLFNIDLGDELGTFCFDNFSFTKQEELDLAGLFAQPTTAETNEVWNEWNSRDVQAYNWQVLGTGAMSDFDVDVVSHEVQGNTHYGLVRYPMDYDATQKYPILIVNHGGTNGVNAATLGGYSQGCYQDYFIIVPSFRGETLVTGSLGLGDLVSDGEVSEFDGDIDDVLALLNGTIDNYAGADDTRIYVFGGSRGGCVSYLMSVREPRISRGVYFYGATDHLTAPDLQTSIENNATGPYYATVRNVVDSYIAGAIGLHEARQALLSRSAIHFLEHLPQNIQIHHGDIDLAVPVFNSQILDAALMANNLPTGEYAYYEYEGGGHGSNMPNSNDRKNEFFCIENQTVAAKALLEGAYETAGMMTTHLSDNNLLPMAQPFNRSPWNYSGNEIVTTFPQNITDWILLEVKNMSEQIIEQRAAFVRNDGVIIDLNGTENVAFRNLVDGESYYLIVRSRNHIALASEMPLVLPQTTAYDFTQAANVQGNTAQLAANDDGSYSMLVGDFAADGVITVTDFNVLVSELAALNQYVDSDANLDGNTTIADFNLYVPNASHIGVSLVRY